MFVPISDINPIKSIRFAYVNVGLIVVNILVFMMFQARDSFFGGNECGQMMLAKTFGLIPLELRGIQVPITGCDGLVANLPAIPEPFTLVSYMFLHGDIWHLLGNMLFLWVFGDNVEDAVGHVKYLLFYILCGIAGALLHSLMWIESPAPLIGASGAVAGVIAAYLLLHPRVNVWVLILRVIPVQVKAVWALGFWIIMNVVFAILPSEPYVAWWAHVGGIVAGALLIMMLKRREIPLLDGMVS